MCNLMALSGHTLFDSKFRLNKPPVCGILIGRRYRIVFREKWQGGSMLGFFNMAKKHVHLELIISRMQSNKENNYKDAAQQDFKELVDCFERLSVAGSLSAKQIKYYEGQIEVFREELKGYTHKDQKPFWT